MDQSENSGIDITRAIYVYLCERAKQLLRIAYIINSDNTKDVGTLLTSIYHNCVSGDSGRTKL